LLLAGLDILLIFHPFIDGNNVLGQLVLNDGKGFADRPNSQEVLGVLNLVLLDDLSNFMEIVRTPIILKVA
jgi:hypothetical protein